MNFQKISNFQSSKAAFKQQELRENQQNRFEIDAGPGAVESAIESSMILD
jgi:hypothetical protein